MVQYSTFFQYKALDQLYNLKATVVDECNPIQGNKEKRFLLLKHFRVKVTRTIASRIKKLTRIASVTDVKLKVKIFGIVLCYACIEKPYKISPNHTVNDGDRSRDTFLCLSVCLFVTPADSGFGDYKNEGSVLRDTLLTHEDKHRTSCSEASATVINRLRDKTKHFDLICIRRIHIPSGGDHIRCFTPQ